MSPEDVARIAQAFALANGHDDADGYSAKVVEAWKTLAPTRREGDVKADLVSARQDAAASREEA